MFQKLFAPIIIGKTYTEEELSEQKVALERALANMELRLTKH